MNRLFAISLFGIILNAAGITFSYPLLNFIGSILILIAVFKLNFQGIIIKKLKLFSILSAIFSLAAFGLSILDRQISDLDISVLYIGIMTFFYIYLTYYYTETLIEHSKLINELASTRSFRGIWTLTGVVAFLYFMADMSNLIPLVMSIAGILLLISAIFYCSNLFANKKLFPTK